MPVIQLLLVVGIALVALLAMRGGQTAGHRAFWRLSGLTLLVVGVLSVLFPDALTRISRSVGIGRGADLVLYLAVVAFLLVSVILFRRLGELEQRYVKLARRMALHEARDGQAGPGSTDA